MRNAEWGGWITDNRLSNMGHRPPITVYQSPFTDTSSVDLQHPGG